MQISVEDIDLVWELKNLKRRVGRIYDSSQTNVILLTKGFINIVRYWFYEQKFIRYKKRLFVVRISKVLIEIRGTLLRHQNPRIIQI